MLNLKDMKVGIFPTYMYRSIFYNKIMSTKLLSKKIVFTWNDAQLNEWDSRLPVVPLITLKLPIFLSHSLSLSLAL